MLPQEIAVSSLGSKTLLNFALRPHSSRNIGHWSREDQGQSREGGALGRWALTYPSAQPTSVISMRPLYSPGFSHATAQIPRPSPLQRTLISLQIEACDVGCNKRQKLCSGASMRAFSL